MKIKDIFKPITNTSIYLALGAGFLSYISFVFLNLRFSIEIFVLSFLLCFSMYNLNRFTDVKEDRLSHPERTSFVSKYRKFLVYAGVLSLIIAFYLSYITKTYALILLILIVSVFYSIKFVPKKISKSYRRLKDIFIIKNITIAVTWVLTTSILVLIYSGVAIDFIVFSVSLLIFVRLFVNTTVFDMRDMKGDSIEGIKTIPVKIGIVKTKVLLYTINTILGLFLLYSTLMGWLPPIAHFANLSTLYAYIYIYFFGRRGVDNKFLCDVVVDGEYILIGVFVFLGTLVL